MKEKKKKEEVSPVLLSLCVLSHTIDSWFLQIQYSLFLTQLQKRKKEILKKEKKRRKKRERKPGKFNKTEERRSFFVRVFYKEKKGEKKKLTHRRQSLSTNFFS